MRALALGCLFVCSFVCLFANLFVCVCVSVFVHMGLGVSVCVCACERATAATREGDDSTMSEGAAARQPFFELRACFWNQKPASKTRPEHGPKRWAIVRFV